MIAKEDLIEIVAATSSSFFGLEAVPTASPDDVLRGALSASVMISGAWTGAVTVTCEDAFARVAACQMFGVETSAVADGDARDAMGELANVVGGNLKSLIGSAISAPSEMSLPMVTDGVLSISGTTSASEQWFAIGHHVVHVCLLMKDERRVARGRDGG